MFYYTVVWKRTILLPTRPIRQRFSVMLRASGDNAAAEIFLAFWVQTPGVRMTLELWRGEEETGDLLQTAEVMPL